MRLPLPIHSYRVPGSTARVVNCYGEALPAGAKGPVRVFTAPGIATHATVAAGEGRGICAFAGAVYAVVGSTAYRIGEDGSTTSLGTVAGTGPVGMAAGTNNLVIAAGVNGYTCTSAGNLVAIADVDWRASDAIDFLDNYIIGVERSTGRWFSSALADETSYDPLAFATAEGAPDNLLTLIADHRQAILFGSESTEIWYNAGNAGFPFDRSPNGFIELGCAGKRAATKLDNSVFWVANDKTVRRLNQLTPTRISTHGVEAALAQYSLSECRAFSFYVGGHLFAVFRFPEGCFVYDATTNEWHERESFGGSTWNIVGSAVAYNETFVLHATSGQIGTLDAGIATEFGGVLRPEWTYQPVYADNRMMFHSRIEVGLEAGVDGLGVDAELQMQVSDDGGKSWRGLPDRSLGLTGEFAKRVYWHRLGRSRQRVYKAAISSPVPMTVTGTFLEAE